MIPVNSVLIADDTLVIRELDDEIIILTESGDTLHTLNELGAFIWKHIDGMNTIDRIADSICAEYEVQKQIALKDLNAFIEELLKKKLISLKK